MTVVTVHEAKTHLSRLIARVLAGEEITIARGHEPVVKLVPAAETKKPPLRGAFKGQFEFDESFWDPLPEDELAYWNGERD
jgi:prevent-host-death family protein